MKYYTKEEFIELSKVSRSTIDRFYRDYTALGKERKIVGKRKDIPESHLKYFSLKLMINEEMIMKEKILKLQKVISLTKEDTLGTKLWQMNWVSFGAISYKSDYTVDTCYNKMVKMFNQLKNDIDDNDLKIFFTTESYDVRYGNHTHFVLDCNIRNVNQINKKIKDHFSWDRVHLEDYAPEEAGIFYIMKEGLKGTGWDFLY